MQGLNRNIRVSRSWLYGFLIIAFTVGYASLRYHYFLGIPTERFSLYVLNKAVSWSAVIFIGWSFLLGIISAHREPRDGSLAAERKPVGLIGAGLALVHVLMSLPILTPSYFPNFFASGERQVFTAGIEASLLFGCLALILFLLPVIASFPGMKDALGQERWRRWQRWAYLAYFLTLLHVLPVTHANWRSPRDWPGLLPPISLLSGLWILLVISLRLVFSRRKRSLS